VLILAGLAVGGTVGIAYACYRSDMRRAYERLSFGSRIADTPCGRIEYAVAGEGAPVLLIHGAGGGYDQGLEFGGPLVQAGLRVIAMSRFGYLRTPLPADGSAGAQADAHACLLDALALRSAAVIGASAGAPSAMQFALRHPERCSAMVLLVPAAYVPRVGGKPSLQAPACTKFLMNTALRFDFLFWVATRLARSTLIEAILATPETVIENATADEQTRIGLVLEHILPTKPRRVGLRNDVAVVSSLQRYELERIAVPTLIIGVADCLFGTFEPARYSADHIAGARFIGYETGGHLWVGHHKEVVSEIVSFLRRN
jgi:2-hydroxy-6-oxonona-2,4-dienedioate hydrolase